MTSTPTFIVSEISKTTSSSNGFGIDMDTDGNKIVVGSTSAKVFVYSHNGTNWVQEAEIQNSISFMGSKVSISGNWLAISNSAGTGTNGSVVIYRNTGLLWEEFQTIVRPTTYSTNGFAADIDISGNTLVVGHMMEGTGGVHVYDFDGTAWERSEFLTVPSSVINRARAQFGISVSIDNDIIAAGGVFGGEGAGIGFAFISKRSGSLWSTPELATPTAAPSSDSFGWSVRVKGNKLLVGATAGQTNPVSPGRAYLFDISGNSPIEEFVMRVSRDTSQTIQDTLASVNDRFGWCVDISNSETFIAVSSPAYFSSIGSIYFYEKVDGVWGPSAMPGSKVRPTNTNQRFGSSFIFVKNGIMVGSQTAKSITWFESPQLAASPTFNITEISKTTSVDIGYGRVVDSDGTTMVTATYGGNSFSIHEYDGSNWNEVEKFAKPSSTSGYFGALVAISGDWIVVSDSNSSPSHNAIVTLYHKVANEWLEHSEITNPISSPGAGFGRSIDVDGDTLVIGKAQSQNGTDSTLRGGAFVYVFDGTSWIPQGGFLTIPNNDTRQELQHLGASVSIENNIIVVGGPGSTNASAGGKGMAFVAKRNSNIWSVSDIINSPSLDNDGFGFKVKIKDGKVIIGAPTGNATDNIPGKAYLYDLTTASVLEHTFTVKTDTSELIQDTQITINALYGNDLAINNTGDVIAIGATNRSTGRGIVYLYEKNDDNWGISAQQPNSWVVASDETSLARFGTAVNFAVDGLMIGASGIHSTYWFK